MYANDEHNNFAKSWNIADTNAATAFPADATLAAMIGAALGLNQVVFVHDDCQLLTELKELSGFVHGIHDATGAARTTQKSDVDDVMSVQYIGGSNKVLMGLPESGNLPTVTRCIAICLDKPKETTSEGFEALSQFNDLHARDLPRYLLNLVHKGDIVQAYKRHM